MVDLRQLRWLTVWLPLLFIVILKIFEDFLFDPFFGRWTSHLVAIGAVGVGALILSFFVFRTVEQTERHLHRQNCDLTALNEVSQVVSGSLNLDDILIQALEKILAVLATEAGEIFLVDESSKTLVYKVHRGLFAEAFQTVTHFPIGDGIPGVVASTGEPVIITDLTQEPRFKRQAVIAQGIRTMASVPLRAANRVVGVMNVADRRKVYIPAELRLLTAIGNQIGMAVENAKLFAQSEKTLGYLNAVIESSGDAIITTDLDGHVQSWNPGAEHIYGWSKAEAEGNYIPMVPEHLRAEVGGIFARLRAGETIFNLETQRRHKSGRLLSVVVTASPVRDAAKKLIGIAGISKDISEKKRMEAELMQQRQSLAILEERERIAREMHDGLAQVLGYVNTKAQAVRRFLAVNKIDEAQAHLLQLEEAARAVYADVREAILGLRTTVAQGQDLTGTLTDYIRHFEMQSGIPTTLVIAEQADLCKLTPMVEVQTIRIIQEALTNIRRHANAQQATVTMQQRNGHALITIEDDGCGFAPNQSHHSDRPRFGLQTMRERAEGVGGALTIHSMPGSGTRICVTLPMATT